MFDAEFQRSLNQHVGAHEERVHNNQLLDMYAFLSLHAGLGYTEFANMSEEERDSLYLAVSGALS